MCSGIGYSLVTNRPIHSGTTPLGYEPDPNHGTREEFKAMCRRIAGRGVPLLIWMSHTGIQPGGPDIDDDWFIRGIDGRTTASWGSIDGGMSACNPGHPGYIEYTKKWIRFYIKECGCKGIFFDCLGWTFPADFRPRSFMRYPGDTNRMTIKFIEEMYACIKDCDPEAILLGEGATLDAPVNIFSISGNPVRPSTEWDRAISSCNSTNTLRNVSLLTRAAIIFLLQGCRSSWATRLQTSETNSLPGLSASGGAAMSFTHLPGDVSLLDDWLFVAQHGEPPPLTERPAARRELRLPKPWDDAIQLTEHFTGTVVECRADGVFSMCSARNL